jgi:hypothetical protein
MPCARRMFGSRAQECFLALLGRTGTAVPFTENVLGEQCPYNVLGRGWT